MSKQFYSKEFSLAQVCNFKEVRSQNVQAVLFQAIQFSLSTQFSSFGLIDRRISVTTTPGQNGTGIEGNKGVLHIPQSSCITETSLSELVSY